MTSGDDRQSAEELYHHPFIKQVGFHTGRNSFCGDVVLYCVNMGSRDKDQIYEKKICSELIKEKYESGNYAH